MPLTARQLLNTTASTRTIPPGDEVVVLLDGEAVVLLASERTNMSHNIRKGFTLIELLIVVVIIGILAAIAIPKFANTKSKAYTAAMKSDLRNLVTAEEAFFSDSGKYIQYDTTLLKFRPSTGVSTPAIT
ncbi:MAG TPA: prepilin-type N-terminal cleavage/methylation domain-containing protein, partial [Gemmatimonadaceae bacterium]